jgi:hypothetical protein
VSADEELRNLVQRRDSGGETDALKNGARLFN